jgi:NAD(P)-dependent dehydrogenase (short-subunit alcohol dehydrogenase family)|tara:strand:+ start:118 stop:813 length:696 start_codon:yes stop_codon:yes gene_type:complete
MLKNIVITGASRGIGKKIADYLSLIEGYKVINISRGKNNSPRITNYPCDVSNYQQVKKTFKKIKNIDVLINNSGITRFSKNPIDSFDQIIKTNLSSFFYCSYEAIKLLKKKKNSSIINISSINAHQAFPKNPGYVSSKGAVVSLTRALALDYGEFNVRVNSISPGYIREGMSEKSFKDIKKRKERMSRMIIKRWGEASDIFGAIEYLISDKSSYLTGQDLIIDGGWVSKGL